MTITRDTVFRHEVAGAGGWGDPLEREPAAVARDVRNELVSRAAARTNYGVALDDGGQPLPEETRQLRAAMRDARGWTETPAVTRS
jgi:N-methylhydantoinase B